MVSPDTLNLGAFKLTLQFLQNRGVSKKTLFHLIDEMSQIWEKESDVKYDGALFPTLVLSRPKFNCNRYVPHFVCPSFGFILKQYFNSN